MSKWKGVPVGLVEVAKAKWKDVPVGLVEVAKVIKGKHCPVCGSDLLLPMTRPPVNDWRVHCNHCGSELLVAVLLNREAWRKE